MPTGNTNLWSGIISERWQQNPWFQEDTEEIWGTGLRQTSGSPFATGALKLISTVSHTAWFQACAGYIGPKSDITQIPPRYESFIWGIPKDGLPLEHHQPWLDLHLNYLDVLNCVNIQAGRPFSFNSQGRMIISSFLLTLMLGMVRQTLVECFVGGDTDMREVTEVQFPDPCIVKRFFLLKES